MNETEINHIYERILPMEFALNMINVAEPTDEAKNNQIFKNTDVLKIESPKLKVNHRLKTMMIEQISNIGKQLIFGEAGKVVDDKSVEPYVYIRGILSVYGFKVDKVPNSIELSSKFRLVYLAGNGLSRLFKTLIIPVVQSDESWISPISLMALREGIHRGKTPKATHIQLHILSDIGLQMNVKDDKWVHTNALLGGTYD